jgi:hypothetical protein
MTEELKEQIIGFYARATSHEAICLNDACIIAGTQAAMQRYLGVSTDHPDDYTVHGSSYEDIMAGLLAGDQYAFDVKAYNLFAALARACGIDLESEDQSGSVQKIGGFVYVTLS